MTFFSRDDLDPSDRITYEPTGMVSAFGRPVYCVTGHTVSYSHPSMPLVRIDVVPGFLTDLATIPNHRWLPNPAGTLWAAAAIVHDVACQQAWAGRITFRQADALLYHAMREKGCTAFTATVFWLACRVTHIYRRRR